MSPHETGRVGAPRLCKPQVVGSSPTVGSPHFMRPHTSPVEAFFLGLLLQRRKPLLWRSRSPRLPLWYHWLRGTADLQTRTGWVCACARQRQKSFSAQLLRCPYEAPADGGAFLAVACGQ